MAANINDPSRWKLFKEEASKRLREPWQYPTFVIYFFGVIMFLAGIGWLIPLVIVWYSGFGEHDKDLITLAQAISTYAIALAATSFMDLIIAIDDPEVSQRPYKKPIAIIVFVAFFIVVALAGWTFSGMGVYKSLTLAIASGVLSVIIWWVSNGTSAPSLEELPPPNTATGGDPHSGGPANRSSVTGGLNQ